MAGDSGTAAPDGGTLDRSGLGKGARITGADRSALGVRLAERYQAGESIRALAAETGRSFGFVHGVIKEAGVTLRGRGGATRGPARQATPPADPASVATDAKPAKQDGKKGDGKKADGKKVDGKKADGHRDKKADGKKAKKKGH